MAFGISFGMNKTKGSSNTKVDKTETVNSTESSDKTTSGVTTNSGTSATTQSGTSGTQTTQAGTNAQNTTGSQSSQVVNSQFSDSVMGGLEGAVMSLFSSLPQDQADMNYESDFDKGSYIASGMQGAERQINTQRDTALNSMYDQFGGRDDSNSMVALLANQARGDSSAQLADVYSKLSASGEGIARDNFMASVAGRGEKQNYLNTVLQALKGGQSTQTGTVQTAEQVAGSTTQSGTQAGQTSNTSNTAEQSTQVQALTEALNAIINGTTRTVGTESTKTKGSSIGGGVSAGG